VLLVSQKLIMTVTTNETCQ